MRTQVHNIGSSTRRTPGTARALASMFAVTGAVHFLAPRVFDPIVPRWLPGSSRSWTVASGLAEWALAALVAHRTTRNSGGLLSAAFLVAVFPANVRTVRIVRSRGMLAQLIAIARLPLQVPLIALALRVGRSAS
ncbi:putative membrane protein [Okibacterium sp. HSC-33S16]|uniref:DoxX family protein n=1 Tax=Okibacterium sp. HSC-33S16 TaxID=2910965 RepID=UPI0020A01F60|nr:hypothetical protein [Okibacterium sp. HSC-33S16]MCP2032708.1 putative membrane protein [Okibacterium sp. HSC-33S16]